LPSTLATASLFKKAAPLLSSDAMMLKLLISLSALVLVAFPVHAQTASPPGIYYGYPAYGYPG
jgi:hypothetical protein